MKVKAYAKINLTLDITGKRKDGYHLLRMIMQNVDVYDEIEIEKIQSGIIIEADKNYIPTDERNLAYKAAEIFMNEFNISEGVKIKITKNIPVAAGMAGGSTDAAAVLKAMKDLFEINVSESKLMEVGLKLGADIPFCIKGGTALCEGIGEIITPLKPFKGHMLVIVKPNFGLSTKDVYKDIDVQKIFKHPKTEEVIQAIEGNNVAFVSENLMNVLENVSLKKHKILREIKNNMLNQGALGALMTGSGPTIFGIFEDESKAEKTYEYFKSRYDQVYLSKTI
ncbi:4-(cytidine 5'-diphospho)-2-C-methyl-D-erythritol kinase [Clostridium grantii]|uniref:4-diphosphocytidyl-2-C-methyl-D-erythritol kinase n=1 Tax=Clostridium grantii DSM 8605 TaxID=1121316 RepID=A0A1M5TL77_9CLOT|nr:4-(cytidine 5'-diphospho)-2-C-methyl-D-erythritol kinase [Clostridium grantii]SHH51410.1 4-diphosphocytidyl-2-C-methyl-D-erythritol kinase [Clostridium grantii DSM 8605]